MESPMRTGANGNAKGITIFFFRAYAGGKNNEANGVSVYSTDIWLPL